MTTSPYQGQITPPDGQDGPPPIAGKPPTLQLPVSATAFSVSAFYQPYKSGADYLAWLMKILNGAPALAPGAGPGFTEPAYAGADTGRVHVADDVGPQNGSAAVSVVIKISTAGTADDGVAKFQWSNDGGVTYGAAINITTASHTDTDSGITVYFSGHFTLGETYSFAPTFQPQASFRDSAGNIRSVVDHNGFLIDRTSEFREEWFATVGSPVAMGAGGAYMVVQGIGQTFVLDAAKGGAWEYAGSASEGSLAMVADPTTGANCAKLITSTNTSKWWNLGLGRWLYTKTPGGVFVYEWEAYLSSVGANGVSVFMGLSDSLGQQSASPVSSLFIQKKNGDTDWNYTVKASAVASTTPPVAATWQRFRIEMHGTATPLGVAVGFAVALFFVNEVLVGYSNLTGQIADGISLQPAFGVETTSSLAGPGAFTLAIGPVRSIFNRWSLKVSL